MSKPAAIPFFGDAYLADTTHLTTEEHGAYFLLLLAAWRQEDCGLPDDDKKLARIAGLATRKWASIKPTIMEFWAVENGRIYQARLRKERAYVDQKSESNRKSAEARWNKQDVENKASGVSERISERNAPPPPPIEEEPNGSPSTPIAPKPKLARKSVKVPMTLDWSPSDLSGDVGEMLAQWPSGRFDAEVAEFREYWIDSGEKRPGWDQTFRSRIRNIHHRVMRDHYGNRENTRSAAPGHSGQRDRRDSFTRAIDDAGGFAGPFDDYGPDQ